MRIEFEDVTFGYGPNATVLHGINLTIDEPGLVCIVGPNGVGKSTLIKCINGILKPQRGVVRVDGRDVSGYDLKDLAKIIAYVPVMAKDCFPMVVLDSVLIGRNVHQKWRTTPKDICMAHRSLEVMDMSELAMRPTDELSCGQHQKVGLARGLVQETEALLLDEPTANLDVRHQIYVTGMLKAIAHRMGKTIVIISHDLNIAAKFADRVIVMAEPGVIHASGTAEEVLTERIIGEVYGVDCEVITSRGRPHVILHDALV